MPPYGIDLIKIVVSQVAEVANIISKFLNGGGIFSLWGIMTPINKLKAIDFDMLIKQVKDADPIERAEIDKTFASSLNLADKALQAKVLATAGFLEESITLAGDGLSLVARAESLVARVKALFSV